MKKKLAIFSMIALIAGSYSCKKENAETNHSQTPYTLNVPPGFPPPYANNMTVEGVTLGRMLYYDPILSSNGLTCSSCHRQSLSFSSPIHVHPDGSRTSVPVHINLAWKKNFLWEGAFESIEQVCMGDFEPEFFNTNMNDLVERLKQHQQYPSLFYEAFNITDVGNLTHQELKDKIVEAIAMYANTLVSSNSRYDKYRRNEIAFTQEELRGYIIFNTEEGDCFHCHGSVLMTDNGFHNTGLEELPDGQDKGLFNFTGNPDDLGKFLSPTLRNVALTAPYMHDGRFQTLEEVVEFYNSGVHQNSPNIDPIMTKAFKVNGLNLTPYDKQCLVDFLKTFTDSSFVTSTAYGSPF